MAWAVHAELNCTAAGDVMPQRQDVLSKPGFRLGLSSGLMWGSPASLWSFSKPGRTTWSLDTAEVLQVSTLWSPSELQRSSCCWQGEGTSVPLSQVFLPAQRPGDTLGPRKVWLAAAWYVGTSQPLLFFSHPISLRLRCQLQLECRPAQLPVNTAFFLTSDHSLTAGLEACPHSLSSFFILDSVCVCV